MQGWQPDPHRLDLGFGTWPHAWALRLESPQESIFLEGHSRMSTAQGRQDCGPPLGSREMARLKVAGPRQAQASGPRWAQAQDLKDPFVWTFEPGQTNNWPPAECQGEINP